MKGGRIWPKMSTKKDIYLDRATKELFQIKEFRDRIIGDILEITEELLSLDIRINNNANFRDSRIDFGYENSRIIVNAECNYNYSK